MESLSSQIKDGKKATESKRQKLRLDFEEKETESGLGPRERLSRE